MAGTGRRGHPGGVMIAHVETRKLEQLGDVGG